MVHDVNIPLNRDPRGGVQQNGAILFAERCELDHRPIDEVPRPRRGKVRCLLRGIVLKGTTKEMKLRGGLMIWRNILEGRG